MDQRPAYRVDPAGADLAAEIRDLRAAGPAARVELPGGVPAWAVTDHAVLRELLVGPEVSKDPNLHWPAWPAIAQRAPWLLNWVGPINMLNTYGVDHARLRKLVAPAFTARRTEAMRPLITETATRLLDGLAARPVGEPVDLKAAYAHALPMEIICSLFGVPVELRADAARLIEDIVATDGTPEQAQAVLAEVLALLTALIDRKRETPGDDLTSALIASHDDEAGRLTHEELIYTLLLVIGAGFETTVNLIASTVHALLTHPEQHRRLRDGEVGWSAVIEEGLRWAPSIATIPLRYAVTDLALPDGTVIRAGDAILAHFAAANRDPAVYGADADAFRPGRAAEDHLAFGYGIHRCIGAPLARAEADTALRLLFDRFPDLRLAVAADTLLPVPSFIAHGVRELPVLLH
ncbi:cytochrome P450 [Streptomyces sp. NPDC092296]|uniref:cytochrome P450 family protein n=1 Tax=Streptomyces sp. NPDC092296 TaxID=3366012 RepID=UPI0037F16851